MTRSFYPPDPPCSCSKDRPNPLCSVHGVFAAKWSGQHRLGLPEPVVSADELERRERARRRRHKGFREP